jgi:hypothetical protein
LLFALALVLALMLLLVLLAAIGLGPGDSGSLGPVPKPPRIEAAVGNSVPLAPPQVALVAQGVVASGKPRSAHSRPAGPPTRRSENEGSGVALAVTPAQAVAVGAPAPAEPNPPAPTAQPVSAPPSEPAPALAATPGPSGAGGGQSGPVAAGGPSLESCEGDEYLITIALAPDAAEGEEASVEIVLKRFNEDGSVDELRLEGDLLDARNLALQLSSEGNCVFVEASEPEDQETAEEAVEEPGAEAVADPDSS